MAATCASWTPGQVSLRYLAHDPRSTPSSLRSHPTEARPSGSTSEPNRRTRRPPPPPRRLALRPQRGLVCASTPSPSPSTRYPAPTAGPGQPRHATRRPDPQPGLRRLQPLWHQQQLRQHLRGLATHRQAGTYGFCSASCDGSWNCRGCKTLPGLAGPHGYEGPSTAQKHGQIDLSPGEAFVAVFPRSRQPRPPGVPGLAPAGARLCRIPREQWLTTAPLFF